MTDPSVYEYEPYPGNPDSTQPVQPPQSPAPRVGQLILVAVLGVILVALLLPTLLSFGNTRAPAPRTASKPTASAVPSTPNAPTIQAPQAAVDIPYSYKVPGPPANYTTTGGMPRGLTISTDGVISGIPTVAGTYTVGVMAVTPEQSLPIQYIQLMVID